MTKYEVHPLAETYPPMSGPEMEALTADIAARGLQRPIVLYEGRILDGRNRYLACKEAGVEPSFVEYEGDNPLGQVISLNLNRDLTAGQRAFVAARQWTINGKPKRGGVRIKGEQSKDFTLDTLCRLHRTNKPSIIQASDLLAEAADLAAAVETDSTSLAAATKVLEGRREEARKQAKDAA